MGAPLFSVIVTTRDRPEALARAITSVLEQTVDDLECVVVDDCGTRPARIPDLVARIGHTIVLLGSAPELDRFYAFDARAIRA